MSVWKQSPQTKYMNTGPRFGVTATHHQSFEIYKTGLNMKKTWNDLGLNGAGNCYTVGQCAVERSVLSPWDEKNCVIFIDTAIAVKWLLFTDSTYRMHTFSHVLLVCMLNVSILFFINIHVTFLPRKHSALKGHMCWSFSVPCRLYFLKYSAIILRPFFSWFCFFWHGCDLKNIADIRYECMQYCNFISILFAGTKKSLLW